MANEKTELENKVKTGDLIFVSKNASGTEHIINVGVAVWLRDPSYTSKLLLATVRDGHVFLSSVYGTEGTMEIVRPDVNLYQVHKSLIEKEGYILDSVSWVVEALNKFSLMIGSNHTSGSLYSQLVNGFRWQTIRIK